MLICPKCNEKYTEGAFCEVCGTPLINEATGNAPAANKVIEEPSPKGFIALGIGAIVIAVASIVGVAFLMMHKPDPTPVNDSEIESAAEVQTEADDVEEITIQEEYDEVLEVPTSQVTVNIQDYADTGYIIPDSSTRYLSRSDFSHLSKDELRIARNEIYARHGRMFNDSFLQSYFNSQSWYRGTIAPSNFQDNYMLNEIEKYNTKLIKDYEISMGYVSQ